MMAPFILRAPVSIRMPWKRLFKGLRVRGNRESADFCLKYARSIPACAGEPRGRFLPPESSAVYPRVCGGTTAVASDDDADRSGSIPACAGEPNFGIQNESEVRVYPRVCGGTPGGNQPGGISEGLSPRVRGNPPASPSPAPQQRSIPACAGEPGRKSGAGIQSGVYPRVCGGTLTGPASYRPD